MTDLVLTLASRGGDGLRVRAELDGRLVEATRPLPAPDRLNDLLLQVRDPRAPVAAYRTLAETLGELVFAGEVGDLLRDAFRAQPDRVVLFAADPTVASWPWEIVCDPVDGRSPVLDGAALVRIAGQPDTAPVVPARGVLIVPGAQGQARVSALQAATRHLARKAGVDVFPADPVTGPGLRRVLGRGAAFVHVEGVGEGGRVDLDDGPVPVERLGLGPDVWLAVLGGAETDLAALRRVRGQGVAIAVGRQLELRPNEAGAVDRELYRALAGGASVVEAVRRARNALARLGGDEGWQWAAPVIWSAPSGDTAAPATLPFPPPNMLPGGGAEAPLPAVSTIAEPAGPGELPYPDLLGAPGHPVRAPVFIHQTIRLVQQSGAAGDPELEARAAAMRALGAGITGAASAPDGLSPDERTKHLADRLVDAIGRLDLPLQPPLDIDARVLTVAQQAAVHPDAVRQAAHALLAGRAVLLEAPPGSGAGRLARLLCESFFDRHPRVVHGDRSAALLAPPRRDAEGTGGWLYRAVADNWRRDELDAYRPDQPAPGTRMKLVARTPRRQHGYRVYAGGWLLLLDADRVDPADLRSAIRAVEAGVVEGIDEGGHPYRVPVPVDFRLVLTATRAPADLSPRVAVVRVLPPADAGVEVERWLAEVEHRCGPAGDGAEALARRRQAEVVAAVIRFCRVVAPVPTALGAAALAYAVDRDGEAADAVDEALTLFLAPRLNDLNPTRAHVVRAFLRGDADALFDATRLCDDDGRPMDREALRGLAAWLDGVHQDGERRAALDAMLDGPASPDVGFLLSGWRLRGAAALPELELPRLRARLA